MKAKLLEVLRDGEGHSIFPLRVVKDALDESGIEYTQKTNNTSDWVELLKDGKQCGAFNLDKKPKKINPKSKYDIVHWPDSLGYYGVHDLQLIEGVCLYFGVTEYRSCMGRGFQYRVCYEALEKAGVIEKEV